MTILVAGGSGLVGSAIVRELKRLNQDVIGISSQDVDLLDRNKTFEFIKNLKPTAIIDSAAKVGGIGGNNSYPVEFLSQNLQIQSNLMDAAHAGGLGGTFGGSPTAVAAGVAVLEQIETGVPFQHAQRIESQLRPRLEELKAKYPVIGDVRGRGAMQAIELVEPGTLNPNSAAVDALTKHCHLNGVVVLNAGTYGNVIRFLPPLTITDELLADALDVLEAGLASLVI